MITLEKILLDFDPEAKNLLPVLERVNAAFGYVSRANIKQLAEYFNLPESRIYETASFYDLIKTEKPANLVVQVCSGTHCTVSGAPQIVRELSERLGVKAGDENNPRVKLEIISCLGRCGNGPVVVINGKVYEKVKVNEVEEILEEWI